MRIRARAVHVIVGARYSLLQLVPARWTSAKRRHNKRRGGRHGAQGDRTRYTGSSASEFEKLTVSRRVNLKAIQLKTLLFDKALKRRTDEKIMATQGDASAALRIAVSAEGATEARGSASKAAASAVHPGARRLEAGNAFSHTACDTLSLLGAGGVPPVAADAEALPGRSSAAQWVQPDILSGTMMKQGETSQGFKKRFFSCTKGTGEVKYYDTVHKLLKIPKGTISLCAVEHIVADRGSGRVRYDRRRILLCTPMRTWVLRAERSEEAQEWVRVFEIESGVRASEHLPSGAKGAAAARAVSSDAEGGSKPVTDPPRQQTLPPLYALNGGNDAAPSAPSVC